MRAIYLLARYMMLQDNLVQAGVTDARPQITKAEKQRLESDGIRRVGVNQHAAGLAYCLIMSSQTGCSPSVLSFIVPARRALPNSSRGPAGLLGRFVVGW